MVGQITGMRVYVERYLCDRPFLRWVKNHRKKRIAKKWRKKYGAIYGMCPGKAFQIAGMGLVVCPCANAVLIKEVV